MKASDHNLGGIKHGDVRPILLPECASFAESPPLVLQCPGGASCLIKAVELSHIAVGEREVEDLGVLCDAFAMGRLGQNDEIMLQAPAEQHLGRGSTDPGCDLVHCLVGEVPTRAERTVRLD